LKFNEPIFHVVGSLRKTEIFVVAAGKQTAYFVDLEKEENAVKSVPIGADIISSKIILITRLLTTGLLSSGRRYFKKQKRIRGVHS
jgi:hypothetical protein